MSAGSICGRSGSVGNISGWIADEKWAKAWQKFLDFKHYSRRNSPTSSLNRVTGQNRAFGFIVCLPATDAFHRNTKNVDHFNDIPAIRKKLQCSLLHIIADSTVNHVVVEMQQYRSIFLIFWYFTIYLFVFSQIWPWDKNFSNIYRLPSISELPSIQSKWVDEILKKNHGEKMKLEAELKNYSNNVIKESIRVCGFLLFILKSIQMGHRDLVDKVMQILHSESARSWQLFIFFSSSPTTYHTAFAAPYRTKELFPSPNFFKSEATLEAVASSAANLREGCISLSALELWGW